MSGLTRKPDPPKQILGLHNFLSPLTFCASDPYAWTHSLGEFMEIVNCTVT